MKALLIKNKVCIYLFTGCFLLNLIGILSLNTLVLSDEIGTIANGAYFAGIDWSEGFAITGLNYYKYGQSLLYIILFKLFDDYLLIYKMALIINAVFISLIPCIVYRISNKFLKFRMRQAVSISCLIGLLPSSLLWSKLVWAETLLYFIPWIVLYLLLDLEYFQEFSKKKQVLFSILTGFIPVLAYMVHARGVVLPIAVFILIVYMHFYKKISLVRWPFYLSGLIIGLGLDKICSSYLFDHLWLSRSTNNSIDSTIMYIKKYDLLSWDGLRTLLNTVLGWLYNVIGSSYGLVTIGFVIAIAGVFMGMMKKEKFDIRGNILYSYSALIFMGAFALGILFFIAAPYEILNLNSGERFDKLIYGRYLAPAFGPLMLVVYYEIFKKHSEMIIQYGSRIIWATVMVLGIFFIYYSGYAENTTVSIIQISTLPMFLGPSQDVVDKFPEFGSHMIFCTFIILAGFIFVMKCLKTKNIYLMTEIVSTAFVFIYIWSIFTCYRPINNHYNDEIEKTKEYVDMISSFSESYPYMAVGIERGTFAYQFAFPEYQIIGSKQGISESYDNLLLVDNDYSNNNYIFSAEYYRFDDETNLLIKGKELNTKINDLGIETERVSEMNIFDSFGFYDENNKKIGLSANFFKASTYFSRSKIPVTKGKYALKIVASDVSANDVSFKVEGRDGKIDVMEVIDSNDSISYVFNIKHTKDNLQFEISNVSEENKNIIVINLEKIE